jgi:hypothetical protein
MQKTLRTSAFGCIKGHMDKPQVIKKVWAISITAISVALLVVLLFYRNSQNSPQSSLSIFETLAVIDDQMRDAEQAMWLHSFLSFKHNVPYSISTLSRDGSATLPLELKLTVSTTNKADTKTKVSASKTEFSGSQETELSAGNENLAKLELRILSRAENESFYKQVEDVFGSFAETDVCEAFRRDKDTPDLPKAHGVTTSFWWADEGKITYVVTSGTLHKFADMIDKLEKIKLPSQSIESATSKPLAKTGVSSAH